MNKVTAGTVWQVNREQIPQVGNKLTSLEKVVPREKVPAEQIHWGPNSLLHRPPQRLCRWNAFAVALLSRRLCRFGLRRLRWAWGGGGHCWSGAVCPSWCEVSAPAFCETVQLSRWLLRPGLFQRWPRWGRAQGCPQMRTPEPN